MSEDVCKGDHQKHFCVLVSDGEFDKIKGLVKNPQFICFNCGRVADDAARLCNPMPLEDE